MSNQNSSNAPQGGPSHAARSVSGAPSEGQILPIFAGACSSSSCSSAWSSTAATSSCSAATARTRRTSRPWQARSASPTTTCRSKVFTGTDNVYTRSRPRWTRTTARPPAPSARGRRATSARGPAPTFMDLGPVAATDTAPPAVSGQKALGVKVDVHRTPQTYLLGIIGQSDLEREHNCDRDHRPAAGRAAGTVPADRPGHTLIDAGGLALRADQRFERPRQLRLDLVGRKQQRRLPCDVPLHAEQPAVHPSGRVPRRSGQVERELGAGLPPDLGSQPADRPHPDRAEARTIP